MYSYRSMFRSRHTFLAVVHAQNVEQVLRNIHIAQDGGAAGVFLINHENSPYELMEFFEKAHREFPDFWMGVNVLGAADNHSAWEFMISTSAAGLWVDDAGIRNSGDRSEAQKFFNHVAAFDAHRQWLYFGGVAFKYQEHIDDPAEAARLAVPFVDVITTSGDGTGMAADIEKIRLMKEAVGDHPIAIASGITPENVHQYLPYADCFLVATGISDSHTELNKQRVRMLADAIR